ncbi:hypothetical protein D5086_023246 [Populus alba]|uniref:Uncharacterized protein n=1 Tax=Populus alba TaxID=43335 RepID=A0ACC4B9E8_POPAL
MKPRAVGEDVSCYTDERDPLQIRLQRYTLLLFQTNVAGGCVSRLRSRWLCWYMNKPLLLENKKSQLARREE